MTGLEPATSGVTGRRSNQLSYIRIGLRTREASRRGEGRAIGRGAGAVKRRAAPAENAPRPFRRRAPLG